MENKFQKTNKLINYLLIGYAFCMPLSKAGVNIFETLIFLTWIIQGNWQQKWNILKTNLLSLSLLLFLTYNIISLFWASDLSFALNYLGKYRHFFLIFVFITSLQKEFVRYILSAFLLGMFLSEIVSYGIFFELFHYKNISPHDPSPFMSHTDYSIYLAFTSMILFNRLLDKMEPFKDKILYLPFFITVTVNLFINGGRTGQVTFIFLFILNLLLYSKRKIYTFFLAISILVIIFFSAYHFSPVFHNRFIQAKQDITHMLYKNDFHGSFATRVSLWKIGFESFKENWLIGLGIGNDMSLVPSLAKKYGFDPSHLKQFTDHHNTFLTTANQLGIIGLTLQLLILFAILRLKFQTFKYRVLNYTFLLTFVMWSFGGITFHTMNPMIFFAFFAGIFNAVSKIEMQKT